MTLIRPHVSSISEAAKDPRYPLRAPIIHMKCRANSTLRTTINACAVLTMLFGIGQASGQAQPAAGSSQPPAAQSSVAIPGFWDPRRRPERPDLSRVTLIRFMTEVDYPPFNYSGPDGNPAGLNVDLARMICEELKIACTVQMRRFDTLLPSLIDNRGDAVMASIAVTPDARRQDRKSVV